MGTKSYRDLDVWKKARAAAIETNKISWMLPKEEQYELGCQMRDAASSVPSNIAEGQARGTAKEFANFLKIARGSNAELQTQLILCVDYAYVSEESIAKAMELSEDVGKMLNKLIRAIE